MRRSRACVSGNERERERKSGRKNEREAVGTMECVELDFVEQAPVTKEIPPDVA